MPKDVSIGWTQCQVREYIPRPRRCYKCHRFGHSSTTCRKETSICVRCGLESHGPNCQNEIKCYNCGEAHPASSQDSFYYNLEQEVITIQTREKLSYSESKRRATEKLAPTNATYATIAAGSTAPIRTYAHGSKQPPQRSLQPSQQFQQPKSHPTRQQQQQWQQKPAQQIIKEKQSDSNVAKNQPSSSLQQIQTYQTDRTEIEKENQTSTNDKPKTDHKIPEETKTISTIINRTTGNNCEDLNYRSNRDRKKRDGSEMEEGESSDRTSKRGMYTLHCPSDPSSSPFLPSPSPILAPKSARESYGSEREKRTTVLVLIKNVQKQKL